MHTLVVAGAGDPFTPLARTRSGPSCVSVIVSKWLITSGLTYVIGVGVPRTLTITGPVYVSCNVVGHVPPGTYPQTRVAGCEGLNAALPLPGAGLPTSNRRHLAEPDGCRFRGPSLKSGYA